MENYAFQNKPAAKKWKGRLGYQFYVTPAVNYRKLTTKVKRALQHHLQTEILTTPSARNQVLDLKPDLG